MTLGVFNPTDGAENIERYATTVTTAIDSEQLSRFGDSDVADAIKRMVGLSINEGKYANVRGLDGRYIATTFNEILMPSTDPMRRDVMEGDDGWVRIGLAARSRATRGEASAMWCRDPRGEAWACAWA